jgi:hypothetical protein
MLRWADDGGVFRGIAMLRFGRGTLRFLYQRSRRHGAARMKLGRREGVSMAELRLYLDESGHSSTHPFVVVAGYVGRAEQWIDFDTEWNDALIAAGIVNPDQTAGAFHMTDFEARRRVFKDWEKSRRENLLSALFAVIERHRLYANGFVVSVDWWQSVDWRGLTPDHLPLQDPYHHAVQGALQNALRLAAEADAPELNGAESIVSVFAQQGEYGGQAAAYLRQLATHVSTPAQSVTIEYAPTAGSPRLQAADMVAFELRWRFTRPDIQRWPMEQILRSRRAAFGAVPPEQRDGAIESLGGENHYIEYSERALRVRPEVRKASRQRITRS